MQRRLDYWKDRLVGTPGLRLPTDFAPVEGRTFGENAVVEVVLDAHASADIRRLARNQNTTLYSVLYAGFAVLLSALSGQDDFVIGVPTTNRQHAELESLMGHFVNVLPLRIKLDNASSVGDLIRQVTDIMLEAFTHREVPLSRVAALLQTPGALDYRPLHPVMLNLVNTPRSALHLQGLTLGPPVPAARRAEVDFSVVMGESGDTILAWANYATDLFERDTIEKWMRQFKMILSEMVANATAKVSDLSSVDTT